MPPRGRNGGAGCAGGASDGSDLCGLLGMDVAEVRPGFAKGNQTNQMANPETREERKSGLMNGDRVSGGCNLNGSGLQGWMDGGGMGGFKAPSDSPQQKPCRGEDKDHNKGSLGLALLTSTLFEAHSVRCRVDLMIAMCSSAASAPVLCPAH